MQNAAFKYNCLDFPRRRFYLPREFLSAVPLRWPGMIGSAR
jgi:hypothetical protein